MLQKHTVRQGESLWSIAQRYGTRAETLQYWNNIQGYLQVGQTLLIPPVLATHFVKAGETLTGIAALYGFRPEQLLVFNPLPNPNYLPVGSFLWIPRFQFAVHTVQVGETPVGIARMYGTTLLELIIANQLSYHTPLVEGQRLAVPIAGARMLEQQRLNYLAAQGYPSGGCGCGCGGCR
jgi:LysM repeat protein